MKQTLVRNIHFSLLGFLGLSAIVGGGALIISPSGKLLGGLPLSILENSPFSDFLIPGIILFLVLGFFPILVVWALIKKPVVPFAEHFNLFKDMHWHGHIVFISLSHLLSGYRWRPILFRALVGSKCFICYTQFQCL